jgi:hypothetical protein
MIAERQTGVFLPGPDGEQVHGWEYRLAVTTEAEREQLKVFIKALHIYSERNEKYNDNWKRMGWRGMLIRVRERAERLWDALWGAVPIEGTQSALVSGPIDVDDAIDLINFSAFLIRAVDAGNRDGNWFNNI